MNSFHMTTMKNGPLCYHKNFDPVIPRWFPWIIVISRTYFFLSTYITCKIYIIVCFTPNTLFVSFSCEKSILPRHEIITFSVIVRGKIVFGYGMLISSNMNYHVNICFTLSANACLVKSKIRTLKFCVSSSKTFHSSSHSRRLEICAMAAILPKYEC